MQLRTKRLLTLLTVVLATQLGAPCAEDDPVSMDEVRLDPPTIVPGGPSYYSGSADIVVSTMSSVQAIDLHVMWDPAAIELLDVVPHPDFDDDGQLALAIEIDPVSGIATMIVDLRHGAAAQGPVKVATVLFEAPTGAVGTLSVDGAVADASGAEVALSPGPAISTP